jgi:predicted SnoaL-like aldol condensation-catalyzing enzyme
MSDDNKTGADNWHSGADQQKADEKEAKKVKARVLTDGQYGKCNDVVEVDKAELKNNPGLDGSKAAVDYAANLPQNQPKDKQAA